MKRLIKRFRLRRALRRWKKNLEFGFKVCDREIVEMAAKEIKSIKEQLKIFDMEFKAMKFRVQNPEHSKAIQERLFEMGYKWWAQSKENSRKIQETNSSFLFADIRDMSITQEKDNIDYFNKHKYTETTLEQIQWHPKQGEMIEVFDACNNRWEEFKFIIKHKYEFVCETNHGNYFGYKQARPINPIRREIEELKARINELEAKL